MSDLIQILTGDALEKLREMPDSSVQCCVTSPPYWGLRDYGVDGQIGLERTPAEYLDKMVAVFREVRRVLKKDGTCWVNLGETYCSIGHKKSNSGYGSTGLAGGIAQEHSPTKRENTFPGLKHKDLCGMPWRVAFALQTDGWYLRSDIIWSKPNPMPESVTDRPTKAHEYIFLLTKSERYFYDAAAIREPAAESTIREVLEGYSGSATKAFDDAGVQDASATKRRVIEGLRKRLEKQRGHVRPHAGFNERWDHMTSDEQRAFGSNKRSVWTVATRPCKDAHFATYPPDLIKPCILAGSRTGDVVLDPFGGSGTTGMVALDLGRRAVLIELNPEYVKLIDQRTNITPGLQFPPGTW